MPEHACSKGLTKECFSKYPKFFSRSLAYRSLYTLVPKTVLAVLKIGLERPLISPQATIPPNIEFLPGWVVFPDVDFPSRWNTADPPPPGVFPPPKFSPLLPETGGSTPLFVFPFEPGPPAPPGPRILEEEFIPSLIYSITGGDHAINLADDYTRQRMGVTFLPQFDSYLTTAKIKLGTYFSPPDSIYLQIQGVTPPYIPNDADIIATSDQILGTDTQDFQSYQEFITFTFPTPPTLYGGFDYGLVIATTSPYSMFNYYQVLAANDLAAFLYYRDGVSWIETPIGKTLDFELWGTPL